MAVDAARVESFAIVMAGLDPAIHLKIKDSIEGDGCRAFAAPRGFGPAGGSNPGMTTFYEGRHLPIKSNTAS
jgi:hypothetical protein